MPDVRIKSQALPAGYKLGDYTIVRVLGQGGFGITYLAEDQDHGSLVVIKENLPRDFSFRDTSSRHVVPLDDSRKSREEYEWALGNFYNEAQLLASIDHPGIVKVQRAFHALDTAYYVMPHLGGVSMDKWRDQNGAPDRETVLKLLRSLLDTLDYLHSHNILHRDIKPQNIIVQDGTTPVLIDFGSARQIISERTATKISSPGYTPMEQLQTHGKTGPWTDLYALGATFYTAISGGRPVDCHDRLQGDKDPLPPLSSNPELVRHYGRNLLGSIDKAMSVKPDKRYQSAKEWAAALQKAKRGGGAATALRLLPWGIVLVLAGVCVYLAARPEPAAPATQTPAAPATDTADTLPAPGDDSQENFEHGLRYFTGDGVPENASKALEWFRKAADKGNAQAQYYIGRCYDKGTGVAKDPKEAVKWYQKAADKGYAQAQCLLAACYEYGSGVSTNYQEAVKWYTKAAEQGHAAAQYNLGVCYLESKGVLRDVKEAIKWFERAAEQGDMKAQYNLGVFYGNGQGVPRNDKMAAEYFRRAADQGLADAQFILGICYLDGKGLPRDEKEAVKWIRKAEAQGYEPAKQVLKELGK